MSKPNEVMHLLPSSPTTQFILKEITFLCDVKTSTEKKKISLEPDSNQWPKDICTLPLQSSALPTELSRDR